MSSFFFQAEDGIRDLVRSRGLGDVYKRQKLYLAAIFFFFIFRMILFISEMERIDTTVSTSDILLSFWMGIRFDVVITGYILLLPFLIISVLTISKQRSCLLYTSPSPRDRTRSRMPSSA